MPLQDQQGIVNAELRQREMDLKLLQGCGRMALDNERVRDALHKVHRAVCDMERTGYGAGASQHQRMTAELGREQAAVEAMVLVVAAARLTLQEAVAYRLRTPASAEHGGES
jgi:hypothetical protein